MLQGHYPIFVGGRRKAPARRGYRRKNNGTPKVPYRLPVGWPTRSGHNIVEEAMVVDMAKEKSTICSSG
jgi:hypothetical protein